MRVSFFDSLLRPFLRVIPLNKMKSTAVVIAILLTLLPLLACSFSVQDVPAVRRAVSTSATRSQLFMSAARSIDELIDRRSAILGGASTIAAALSAAVLPSPALAGQGDKIVVFGGSGYVGAYVGQMLSSQGYKVVSVSRSSPSDQADKIAKILGKPLSGIEYASLDASTDELSGVLGGATAVISCVGVAPGGSNQRAGNGAVNVRIADAAKAAGIKRFVYISVASELANGPAKFLLGDYLKGKAEAEAAVIKDFGSSDSLVVKPAIIAGGPPGELRPPGPPGVKPAAVEDVAKAVVAGALGQKSGTIDGNAAISSL